MPLDADQESGKPLIEYAVGDINSTAPGTGARANAGKPRFSLVPMHLLAGCARVFMYGLRKYSSYNWSKGSDWSIAFDCLIRHLFKYWYLGEEIDEESGEHHLHLAQANLFILQHNRLTYPEGDDRPPKWTHFHETIEEFNTLYRETQCPNP